MYAFKIPVELCFLSFGVTKVFPQFGGCKRKASKADVKIRLCRGRFSCKKVSGGSTKMVENQFIGCKRTFC